MAINNRSLAALSEAGMRPTNVTTVSKGEAEALEPGSTGDRLAQVPTPLGESLPSPNIAVTPSQEDLTVLRVISIPEEC